MAYSSILGADTAPEQPSGRDASLLGPSDNSDSGSDTIGTTEALADSDAAGTGERASVTPGALDEGADITPDQVVRMADGNEAASGDGNGFPEADPDGSEMTDLDADTDADEADAAADGGADARPMRGR
jgi:hypothetical protein